MSGSSTVERLEHDALQAPLEKLPTEIRLWLLSVLRLDELRALTHASPTFHQDYHHRKKNILGRSLEVTLGSVAIDAYAAYRTSSANFTHSRTLHGITRFIKSYNEQRLSQNYSFKTEGFNEQEIKEIVTFHLSVVQPLMRYYAKWILNNFAKKAGVASAQFSDSVSLSESTRLLRSLYRFQLGYNLYGQGHCYEEFNKYCLKGQINISDVLYISKDFLSNFEFWEVEEISCFHAFAEEKFDQILTDIRWDVHQNNPKFDHLHRPPTPEGAFDLDSTREFYLHSVMNQGLELLHSVLFTVRDHDHLVLIMVESLSRPASFTLGYDLEKHCRISDMISDMVSNMVPFKGDSELEGRLGPPLAWAIIWGGTYSDQYGEYLCQDGRGWGYVFWDAVRFERAGAKELLEGIWEEVSAPEDPLVYTL